MSYTPGPWRLDDDVEMPFEIRGANGQVVICIYDDWTSKDPSDADARLIVAAPELIEALEQIATETWNPAIGLPAKTYAQLHDIARAAIAKARGEL